VRLNVYQHLADSDNAAVIPKTVSTARSAGKKRTAKESLGLFASPNKKPTPAQPVSDEVIADQASPPSVACPSRHRARR